MFHCSMFFSHRYQIEVKRSQQTQPAITVEKVSSVRPERVVRSNNNRLSPMLTVPKRDEVVPLSTLNIETHDNYAFSDKNTR